MKRSFMTNITDIVAKKIKRYTIKSVTKKLNDFKKNKNNYKIPFFINISKKIKTKYYDGMKVFEMEPSKDKEKYIMYIHGGAYIDNFSLFHWLFLKKISKKTGCGITAPNYLLLPKYTYKYSHDKVLNYYKNFSKKHDIKNVVLIGDSAGGGFVLALLQEIKKAKLQLPGKVILISPFVDAINVDKSMNFKDSLVQAEAAVLAAIAWSGGDDLKLSQISPINGDLKGLPPIEIYLGTEEVLYKQCMNLYEKLKEENIDVTILVGNKMGHVYPILPIPEAKDAIKNIVEFIEK